MHEFEPDYSSPPGETLQEALQERGWSPLRLSKESGLDLQTILEVIESNRPIDTHIAGAFEKAFGASATFWLRRQEMYQKRRKV